MRILLPLIISSSLLLSGCASSEPTPTETTPVVTSVTQAPEETSATQTEASEAVADPGASADEVTEQEPAGSAEPKETASEDSKPETTKTATPKPAATKTPESTPTKTASSQGYSKAQVAQKNSRSACWVVVSGSVYNLTDWVTKHPGGASAITSLCGGDATDAFEGKHGGEARPSSILESYYLGPLVD